MNLVTLLLSSAVAFGLHILAGRWEGIALVVDPLLVVAVLGALPGRPSLALTVGLITGALQDGWNSTWYGEHTFTHLVVAYLVSLLAQRMDLIGMLPAAAAVACATLADWGLQVGLRALFDRPLGAVPSMLFWGLAVLANTGLALAFHRVLMAPRDPKRRR